MHPISYTVGLGLLALSSLALSHAQDPKQGDAKYIGAAACKNCHNDAAKGEAFAIWSKSPHAKAYETLATPQAKQIAKDKGIDDPQKAEQCLKCHVTAFGVDAEHIKRGFKMEAGVQCESCHGPAGNHQQKRMKEAMKPGAEPSPVTPDEISTNRSVETCAKCHNKESPTYKPFCLKERMAKIEHYDPRKKRTEEELKKLRETCSPDCEVCGKKDKEKEGGGK